MHFVCHMHQDILVMMSIDTYITISMFCHDIMQAPFPLWFRQRFRQREHRLAKEQAKKYVYARLVGPCMLT